MKIWIEMDRFGNAFLHTREPYPSGFSMSACHWDSPGLMVSLFHCDKGELSQYFTKRIKGGNVAEFELKCIWESA